MPEISVIIPTYKRPDLLKICLLHLNNQSIDKARFEVIVVSDGSDEITKEAVSQFKENYELNVHYLSTPSKKGPAAARNLGWRSASSDFIAFTDDDCQPKPGWLSAFLNRYKKVEGELVAVAFSGFTNVPIEKNPTDFALNTHGLQYADFITANCACSKCAMKITGGFDERYGTAWREDSDLEFNFIRHRIPIFKASNAIVVHPVRKAPWGVSIKEQKKGLYDALIYKKFPDLYRKKLSPKIIYDFYFIVLTEIISLMALMNSQYYLAAVTCTVVLIMIIAFFALRIKNTKKSINHLTEMFITSMILPFLSVYWRIFGAMKFRVFFF